MFVQLAAPSRSALPRYQEIEAEVDDVVSAVNAAYQTKRWRPIVYLKRHHDHRDIYPYYRHADFCMVTSLHDGMNLVAKEFISVRGDDDGALILSQFTGASSELRDALLVNPYDVDAMADAIRDCRRDAGGGAALAHGADAAVGARAEYLSVGGPPPSRAPPHPRGGGR